MQELLKDERIKLLDQDLSRYERGRIVDQLKSDYRISKNSYQILRDRLKYSNPKNIRRCQVSQGRYRTKNRLVEWIESEKRQGFTFKKKKDPRACCRNRERFGNYQFDLSRWLCRFKND